MILRDQLKHDLNTLLQADALSDYCPNGLQVEGRSEIKKIITGVTASQALIDAAIAKNADAMLVHHGYFWKSEALAITGSKRTRIATLLAHDINLFAYHLPLDIHPEFGNNVQLAKHLGISLTQQMTCGQIPNLLAIGRLTQAQSCEQFAKHLETELQHQPLVIQAGDHPINHIAWCTGAAQGYIEAAHDEKVDAYISGEVSEATYHFAIENKIHYFAAGHHATERYGIQALGEYLANQYQLEHEFIDIHNPV